MNLCDEPGNEIRRFGKHRLVEECEEVAISAVQSAFGKKTLLAAIRQARPVRMPVLGGIFELWLIDQPHRLPGRFMRQSPLDVSNCRIWLQCPCCRRIVGKLCFYYLAADSLALSDLLCRTCHGLVYQSQNCGDNRWYRDTARPLKRLLSEKRRLMVSHLSPRVETRLAEIENEILALRQKLQPKTQPRNKIPQRLRSLQRRTYRDLSLFGLVGRCDRVNIQPDRSSADRRPPPLPVRKTNRPEVPRPSAINKQLLDEDSQFWLDAISEFRQKGLITDDHLHRSPKLKRALEMLNRE